MTQLTVALATYSTSGMKQLAVPTHPSDAPASAPSTTDPTPTTAHPMQTAVAGPPAGRSKPKTGGQPPAAWHDQAEIPPERPAKPDAPATVQAGRSSRGSAGSQGASGKRKSPKPRITGTREEEGEGRGWRQGPLATCGASGSARAACSRSRHTSGRRHHRSGFACRRVCHQTPSSSGQRPTPW